MLKLEQVKKQYKNFTLDCSLEVRPGCITGLIGQMEGTLRCWESRRES